MSAYIYIEHLILFVEVELIGLSNFVEWDSGRGGYSDVPNMGSAQRLELMMLMDFNIS